MSHSSAGDWHFSCGNHLCGLRAAGVLVQDGKILVQRDADGREFALPGGHVKLGETLQDSLIREFLEETGRHIRCERMLWSEECFWEWNGKKAHNLCFYFLIRLCDGESLPDTGSFFPQKDNENVLLGYLSIDSLQEVILYPEFLKKEIHRLDSSIQHFITYA